MQMSESAKAAVSAHKRVQSSTTLNRKYVKRPTRNTDVAIKIKKSPVVQKSQMQKSQAQRPQVQKSQAQKPQIQKSQAQKMQIQRAQTRSPQIQRFYTQKSQVQKSQLQKSQSEQPIAKAQLHPVQATANSRMKQRSVSMQQPQRVSRLSASELKDQAIKRALASAAGATPSSTIKNEKESSKKTGKIKFGFGRVVLALSCAAAAVFAIAYFVNLNMPDISLRVAAMQTGINVSFPGYVPRDYKISGITSEDGKISLNFFNHSNGESFVLIEEKSSWDSNALLSNFVKPTYEDNYSIIREQGLTIYISGNDAAWVNGGIIYKIEAKNNKLTTKQICSIATSL